MTIKDSTFSYVRITLSVIAIVILVLYFIGLLEETFLLYLTYFFLSTAIISMGGAMLIQLAQEKKRLKKISLGIGIIFISYGIAFLFASDDTSRPVFKTFNITPLGSKLISTFIWGSLSLILLAIIIVLVISALQFLKNK